MAVAIRSQTSTTYASRTNTVLTAPTGLANNDILLAFIFSAAQTTGPVPTPPTGFTQIGTSTSVTDGGGFNGKFSVFWKRAASESGSYTFTHSAASSQGVLLAISGAVTSGSPVDVFSSNSGLAPNVGVGNNSSTATGVTTTAANDLLLYLAHDWAGSGALSPPTGFTELFDGLVYGASKALTTAGATGNVTQVNGDSNSEPWAAWLVAIAPATSGSPYTLTAATGSFGLTGQAARLAVGRKLPSVAGSFALTGVAAGLKVGRKVTAATGAFNLSGQAASLRAARKLAAAKGSFVLTGIDAALTKSGAHAYTLACGSGSFLFTGYAASLIYAPVIGKTNPLGRLNMYTGTLGAMSNREDWIVNISFTDEGGDAFDISSAQSIGVYICRQGCPNDPVLTATLGSGIVLTDNFTMQWAFTENDMQRLHPSQYDVFCRVEIGNITTQVLSASVAIVEGGPRQ